MPTIIDGTAGITFPNSTIQASAGQVLQVVQATTTTETATTSTSFVDTTATASITPKFSTSKILVLFQGSSFEIDNNTFGYFRLLRGSTVLCGSGRVCQGASGLVNANPSLNYLDSPATTSSTTYKVQIASFSGGNFIMGYGSSGTNSPLASVTLMEIAG
jgi:hypothetical protein